MERIIFVSNRLPVSVSVKDDQVTARQSVGGLATGMKSFYKSYDSLWIGWAGIDKNELNAKTKKQFNSIMDQERCSPVFIDEEDFENYYSGFSNKTIWPLFHYFTQFTEYDKETWNAYKRVNRVFADAVVKHLKKGDKIWVHDYHLLLLPQMIRDRFPDVSIGFFLHIPFPSYEVFRIIPWRKEIIEGMLGADLLGFHTFDYERHFLSSVRRLLGYEISFNQINMRERLIKVDNFPMGIDYDRFHNAALNNQKRSIKDKSEVQKEIDKYMLMAPDRKFVLSIDRLDYSKGISNRLLAYERFLEKYPGFQKKVTLIMLSVPSRTDVDHYQMMKSEVDELVGRINGRFSTIEWTPVWYFYRSMPFESLIELYSSCEIGLLTPIRDGMNLVAKEYIAARVDGKGVLILSEMAGAAKEMSEALIINPNNMDEIADAINEALIMPDDEQTERISMLQKRLKRYDVERWAQDFMNRLDEVIHAQQQNLIKKINKDIENSIVNKYKQSEKRILFLDYDGTLVGFKNKPEQASPDDELYSLFEKLSKDNEVVLISGRDKDTLDMWFRGKNLTLIVEHGVWIKEPGGEWQQIEPMNSEWKELIRPVIELYVDRTPGSLAEEKNFSLVWHYRKSDPELGILRAIELKDELRSLVANHNLEILEGNKVIEIKNSGINKGRAALRILNNKQYNFILGIGDDWTDEYLFQDLPPSAVTIKIGFRNTQAKYNYETHKDARKLLQKFVEVQ